jgi:RNA polymerase sigma-70 factor (sigma-E family)
VSFATVGLGVRPGASVAALLPASTFAWIEAAEAILAAMADPLRSVSDSVSASSAAHASDATAERSTAHLAEVGSDVLVAELFEQESTALVRLARLFTDDRNAAEDLVQEAFVRLHHAAHRIEDRTRAAAYLRSIVLNLARDHNRRGLMSLRHFEALTPAASPEAIDDRIVLDEQQAAVVEALHALSPQQRDCLVLRFYLELSEKETADTLGISPNSVKTHCRRGFDRLRIRLEGRT